MGRRAQEIGAGARRCAATAEYAVHSGPATSTDLKHVPLLQTRVKYQKAIEDIN